mgnify:CR=1 FL=1
MLVSIIEQNPLVYVFIFFVNKSLTYFQEMIKNGILNLKDRNGSSRQALKKYIQNNYKITASNFDSLFNAALRRGVEKEIFIQQKGTSGPVKLNKKKPAA